MSRPRARRAPLEPRILHGATCTWWGSRREAAVAAWGRPNAGLPCCPQCGGELVDVRSEAIWWRHVSALEREGRPHFRQFVAWLRGRCFPSLTWARLAYERQLLRGAA